MGGCNCSGGGGELDSGQERDAAGARAWESADKVTVDSRVRSTTGKKVVEAVGGPVRNNETRQEEWGSRVR